MSGLRYLSVCSGIEAATQAWHPLGWTPVAFSEIESFPSAVIAHHYPTVPNRGDMSKFAEWPDEPVDLLCGGTPCQSFSVAGLRKGLADPRGNLALTYLAIAARYRPRWIVWENVPGVLSSNGGRDFGAFLGGLGQLGYGFAYRVLDAQYVRTRRFPFAVPQRRRRVFVVGYLGDWRRAAAVLFDRESVSGNPPPRREAGQGPSPTLASRPTGGGGLGTDFDLDGGLISMAHGQGGAEIGIDHGPTLTCNHEAPIVAHSLRAEGFDASEDGTGRGTPLVAQPIAFPWQQGGSIPMPADTGGTVGTLVKNQTQAVAFDLAQITSKANRSTLKPVSPTLMKDSNLHAVEPFVMMERGRKDGPSIEFRQDGSANAILTPNGGRSGLGVGAFAAPWAVRRLTPTECERLQGFPDGFTEIPWRGKPADQCPDGPRYKALGNSMAVNVMSWIGERIALVDALREDAA